MVTYIVKHVDGGRLLDNEKNVSPISFPPNKVLTLYSRIDVYTRLFPAKFVS